MEPVIPIATKVLSASDIGTIVRRERKKRSLTQAALAKAASVGTRFISELENGKPTLQLDKLLLVLNYLNISLLIK